MAEYESRDSDNVRIDWWTPLDVTSGKMNLFSHKRLYTTYFSLFTDDIKDTLPHVSPCIPDVSPCIPMYPHVFICGDSQTRKKLSEDGTCEKFSKELILRLRAAREKYQPFGQMETTTFQNQSP